MNSERITDVIKSNLLSADIMCEGLVCCPVSQLLLEGFQRSGVWDCELIVVLSGCVPLWLINFIGEE